MEVHFATAKHWMELLERVFYGFMVRPFGGRSSRALKKEPKWYLWDWTEIDDAGFRFENLVAVSKALVHFARLLRPERAVQLVAAPIDPAAAHEAGAGIDVLPAASFLHGLV